MGSFFSRSHAFIHKATGKRLSFNQGASTAFSYCIVNLRNSRESQKSPNCLDGEKALKRLRNL